MELVALTVSIGSLVLSVVLLFVVIRLSEHMPTVRKINLWRTEVGDLEERMGSLETRLRRVSSKYAMRERRESGKLNGDRPPDDLPDPKVDPEGWKREMNRRLQLGTVKPR